MEHMYLSNILGIVPVNMDVFSLVCILLICICEVGKIGGVDHSVRILWRSLFYVGFRAERSFCIDPYWMDGVLGSFWFFCFALLSRHGEITCIGCVESRTCACIYGTRIGLEQIRINTMKNESLLLELFLRHYFMESRYEECVECQNSIQKKSSFSFSATASQLVYV